MALQDNLRKSGETYRAGYTCSQAVFCAFAKEMNLDEDIACQLYSSIETDIDFSSGK